MLVRFVSIWIMPFWQSVCYYGSCCAGGKVGVLMDHVVLLKCVLMDHAVLVKCVSLWIMLCW